MRKRQITVTLSPVLWAEFERRRAALIAVAGSERGIDSLTINDWLTDLIKRPAAHVAAPVLPTAEPSAFDILDD